MTGASVDCEAIGGSWWGQPVNTLTAFAFLGVAVLIWARRRDLVTSLLVAMIGVGSIAFHGPMPPWGEYLHDLAIVWMLVWILAVDLDRREWSVWAMVLAALASITPAIADPVQAGLAVAVIVAELRAPTQRKAHRRAVGLLAVGAVVGTLSRTGWPLCNPDSIWQGHGFWHVASAAALAIWALGTTEKEAAVA
ncbi:MAG TPA: hypothetical protein VID03_00470 [Acidimicrobiia bacterium]